MAEARRRARAGEPRAQMVIRLSDSERRELRTRAAARGVSVTMLLVNGALERPLPAAGGSGEGGARESEGTARRRSRDQSPRSQLQVKVSEAERRGLRARADARGISVGMLMVNAALERPLPAPHAPAPEGVAEVGQALDGVREQLLRVGNNLNQLAHAANIAGEIVSERRLAGGARGAARGAW